MMELFVMEMLTVYQTKQAEFIDKIDVFNEDRRPPGELNFGRFNNSLYFVFGLVDFEVDWDVMNNPYVQYKGFEFHHAEENDSSGHMNEDLGNEESHDGHRNLARLSLDHPRRIIDEKYEVDLCP